MALRGPDNALDTRPGEPAPSPPAEARPKPVGRTLDLDSGRAHVAALEAELDAASRAAADAAAAHQDEIERLQRELVQAKRAVVTVQESMSWRVTRPLRAAARLLRGERR
jgi:phage-related tail protein